MNTDSNELKMTFMPNTIEHLGARLYSTIPPVISELVANSYDADASSVLVRLNDSDPYDKSIVVADNGHGMTFDDINNNFLRIGRNRRDNLFASDQKTPKGRLVIGKKGLGKLSFFGIASIIEVATTKDGKRNTFRLDWAKIIAPEKEEKLDSSQDYKPEIIELNIPTAESPGTTITLKNIRRMSDFNARSLAVSLSKFFILDNDFSVNIQHNDEKPIEITNNMKYESLDVEFKWEIPNSLKGFDSSYKNKDKVIGQVFTTKKPIQPATNMRGITLFSRKKLVNLPEYFSDTTSSHVFSYLSGWLEVDFIDDLSDDVIETNRQSLDWDNPEISDLKKYLQSVVKWLEKSWREQRKADQTKKLTNGSGIDINKWKSLMPNEIKTNLNPIIAAFEKDVEFPEKQDSVITGIKNLHALIPEYPYLHWRHLHPNLQSAIETYYKKGEYYAAVLEGMKNYMSEVKRKTGSALTDRVLLENIFAVNKNGFPRNWSVVNKYTLEDGSVISDYTKNHIAQGYRDLAVAMWKAFRCPLTHDPAWKELKKSGIYTEKDCLDALSMLSHLFRRLDDIESVNNP